MIGFRINRLAVLFRLHLVILVLLISACATSEKKGDTDGVVQDIEIKEEFGVDESVSEIFKQAVELLREKKYNEAITLLKQVVEASDKHSAPFVNLGIAYLKVGKIDESEENFKKALTINPDHPVTNNELAIAYRKSGRFDEARQRYQHVIAKYPLFLPARKNLGILCDLFLKDFQCAIEQYGAYLSLKPEDEKVKIWFTDVKRRAGVK